VLAAATFRKSSLVAMGFLCAGISLTYKPRGGCFQPDRCGASAAHRAVAEAAAGVLSLRAKRPVVRMSRGSRTG
jgi:hypothetical protein